MRAQFGLFAFALFSLPAPALVAGAKLLSSADFSSNGKLVAAGGDRTVTVVEAATGKVIRKLGSLAGQALCVRFSPNGKWLAASGGLPGRSGEVKVWELSTWKETAALEWHSDTIQSIAWSPDSARIATASYDKWGAIWTLPRPNIRTRKPLDLKDHIDAVYGVAFSPKGDLVATCGGDRGVKVWDAETGKRLYTLSDSTAEVYCVAFSPSGRQIVAGSADKQVRLWDAGKTGGKLVKAAFAHDGAVLQTVFSTDGSRLFTSGEDGGVKAWNAASLSETRAFPKQPDWPQGLAVAPGGRWMAVARQNGSLVLYDTADGKVVRSLLAAVRPNAGKRETAEAKSPPGSSQIPGRRLGDSSQRRPPGTGGATLFQAELSGISPSGFRRGTETTLTLSGARIGKATAVYFDDPEIVAIVSEPRDKNENILKVAAKLGPGTRIGIHRVYLHTPLGTTGSVAFSVGDWPEVAQAEPNDAPEQAMSVSWPCTLVGTMDQPGDTDSYQFEVKAGDEIVAEVIAQPIRSRLQAELVILDAAGKTVAKSRSLPGMPDPFLGFRAPANGHYVLQVRDFEGAAGGDVSYRIHLGAFAAVTETFPPGVRRGETAEIHLKGFNLGSATVKVTAPSSPGAPKTIAAPAGPGVPALVTRQLHVGEDPEVNQTPGNHSLGSAQTVRAPVTVNGRLNSSSGAVSNFYRFRASKGEKLIVETFARRIGSPLDSEIEVLDSRGQPVEQAVLRAVTQTETVFNDRPSTGAAFRVLSYDHLRLKDMLLIGREVVQLYGLPKGPDEDIVVRNFRGQRYGFLGTTPEFHTIGTPIYTVEVHPPGSKFSPNGYPLTPVYYRNDDGGPLHGKDSLLVFSAPYDGEFVVRITDTRGESGEDFVYRLLIRPERPDFKVAMTPVHPNLPKGGAATIDVECERYDGFSGSIELSLEGLPPGFRATSTRVVEGEMNASLLLIAEEGVSTPTAESTASVRLVAKAVIGGKTVTRTAEPDRGVRRITVLPSPDLRVATDVSEVLIRPGEEAVVTVEIDRQGNFGARVPVSVSNLPYGVRVQHVGLNGILVTESETSRAFTLYCEPWVEPQSRPIYVTGQVEGGVSNAAAPLTLRVLSSPRAASSARRGSGATATSAPERK